MWEWYGSFVQTSQKHLQTICVSVLFFPRWRFALTSFNSLSQLSRLLCFTTWPLKKKHCGKGAKLASATSAMALVVFFPTTEIGLEIRFFIRLNSLLHHALLWHHWWCYDQFGALKFWANLSEPVFTNWPNRATSIYLEIFLLLLVMLHKLVDSFNFLLGLIRSIKKAAIWSIFQTVVWDLTLLWRNSVNGIRVGSSLSKSSNFEMILKTMLSAYTANRWVELSSASYYMYVF